MSEGRGLILKGIGGFYTVRTDAGDTLEGCRVRGILRKQGQKPVAGDWVALGQEAGTHTVDAILPRRNYFIRPPVANVDVLFLVASTCEPKPSGLVLDKLCAVAIDQEALPVLVVTKTDLADALELVETYKTSGIEMVLPYCTGDEEASKPETQPAPGEANREAVQPQPPKVSFGYGRIRQLMEGNTSVFCGNTGVGKSTLMNALAPGLAREVGQISQKLGRGRHTTREVELFPAGLFGVQNGWVADTPGFASFDVQSAGEILAGNLQLCFPEIKSRIGQCKFSGCTHLVEKGCAVRAAVEAGEISEGRYASYVALYNEAREREQQY